MAGKGNEVWLVFLEPGEVEGQKAYRTTAAAFDPETNQIRPCQQSEVSEDLGVHIDNVSTDINEMARTIMRDVGLKFKAGEPKVGIFVDLLLGVGNLPAAVTLNMLAVLLFEATREAMEDDGFLASLGEIDPNMN
jgi:hypothetical protein